MGAPNKSDEKNETRPTTKNKIYKKIKMILSA